MARVVIDISENEYKTAIANADYYKSIKWGSAEIWDSLKNGTILPKGNGNLIDANDLKDQIDNFIGYLDEDMIYRIKVIIDKAPIIVGADKEAKHDTSRD